MLSGLARVVAVMGKGGVGKTTVAAGLATLARTEGPAVLVEFGDGEAGKRALGASARVEHRIVRPDESLARAARGLFGSALLAKLAVDNFAMRPLLRVAPGLRELAMLEAVRQISEERPGARVVVDMPATGHGVAWLRTARQGRDFLAAGPLYELCDRLVRELVAPQRLSPVIVTLPERLVIEETLELARALALEVGVPAAAIVLNGVTPEVSPEAASALLGLDLATPSALRLRSLVEARMAARAEVNGALELARAGTTPVWCLPRYAADPSVGRVAEALGPLREAA